MLFIFLIYIVSVICSLFIVHVYLKAVDSLEPIGYIFAIIPLFNLVVVFVLMSEDRDGIEKYINVNYEIYTEED